MNIEKEMDIVDTSSPVEHVEEKNDIEIDKDIDYNSLFTNNPQYIAQDFDFPITKANVMGMGNFSKQKFGANNQLVNGSNGIDEETIYEDKPVYAIGNGYVTEAKMYGSNWGNVIKIVHSLDGNLYESIYAHFKTMAVKPHQFIKKGEQIGTIITCNKLYHTHLHFEIRDSLGLGMDSAYSKTSKGRINPSEFIKKQRN